MMDYFYWVRKSHRLYYGMKNDPCTTLNKSKKKKKKTKNKQYIYQGVNYFLHLFGC
jgi:hypothetical protein